MTARTGKPRGRPKGAMNKRTEASVAQAKVTAAALAEVLPAAFEGDAHALLMFVYKDPSQKLSDRLDAAGKAIKFEKPALSSVEAKVTATIHDLSEEDLDAEIRALAIASGLAGDPDGATEH